MRDSEPKRFRAGHGEDNVTSRVAVVQLAGRADVAAQRTDNEVGRRSAS